MPKKSKLTTIEKILQGKRYTRAEVEGLKGDIEEWAGTAETRAEQVEALTGADLPDLIEKAEALKGLGGDFVKVAETLAALTPFLDDLGEVEGKLREFQEMCSSFEENADVWLDVENDKEDIAAAKEEMESAVEQLVDIKNELKELGMDLEIEA